MSEHRRVTMDGEIEPKDMSKYIRETKRPCPTCGKSKMFVRLQEESTVTLECPNCDLVEHLPLGLENPAQPPVPPAPPPAPEKGKKKK